MKLYVVRRYEEILAIKEKRKEAKRIAEVPKAETSYEDVVEYCKKRCLVVITNELYEELKRR